MDNRICFLSPHIYGYFNPTHGHTGGGAERQLYLLSTSLANYDGFDVHVIVGDYGQPKVEHRDGVTLHRAYPLKPRQHIFQPIKHTAVLANTMKQADADVYIYRGSPRNASITYLISRFLCRKFAYNFANDSHIAQRPSELARPLQRLFTHGIQNADGILTQTEFQQSRVQNVYNTNSTVVPNGYPAGSNILPHNERKFFLWVGTLDKERKQPHRFLDLAEQVPEEQFRLVGPIDETDSYHQHLMNRAAMLNNLKMAGEISPKNIHDEYREAIALVNTSAYEGFPNTFLEAWRQATTVLSLEVDPERFIDASDSYAHGSMDQLAELVRDIANDLTFCRERGEFAQRQFEKKFQIESVAKQYAQVLKSALH